MNQGQEILGPWMHPGMVCSQHSSCLPSSPRSHTLQRKKQNVHVSFDPQFFFLPDPVPNKTP